MFCYLKAFNTNQPFTNHMDKASRHIHFMHLMLALKPEEVYETKELRFQRCFVSICVPCFHLVLRGLPALHCLLHRHQKQHIFEPQCNSVSSLLTHLEPEAGHQVWMKKFFNPNKVLHLLFLLPLVLFVLLLPLLSSLLPSLPFLPP